MTRHARKPKTISPDRLRSVRGGEIVQDIVTAVEMLENMIQSMNSMEMAPVRNLRG
jgi:hypothetical protein